MKDIYKLKQDEERLEKRLLITRNRIAAAARMDEKAKFRIFGASMLKAEKAGPIHNQLVGTILDLHVTNTKDRMLVGLSTTATDRKSNTAGMEENL